MTIRFLYAWQGYATDAVVTLTDAEEAALIADGLARDWTGQGDGRPTPYDVFDGIDHIELAADYAETGHSFQVFAGDLTLDDAAGSDDGTDPKFLSPFMGNIFGDAVAGEGNYLAGAIGAFSVATHSSVYPTAGAMGVIMDGATGADAAVLAVIDGSDPSAETTARAAFGVRQLNANAASGVDYGVDLCDDASSVTAFYTGGAKAFTPKKAEVRLSNEVCILTGDGAPVDYTDGDPAATGEGYAAPGSMYVDTTNAKLYLNGGTKAQPTWKLVTSAA